MSKHIKPQDTAQTTARKKRVVNKDKHHADLLDATARTVAEFGISGTTINRIQEHSGLSRGMINLHFRSKDNLFFELLNHLGRKYNDNWQRAISTAPEAPGERLLALIAADFSHEVMNEIDSACWTAFRAEAGPRKEFKAITTTRDKKFVAMIRNCCKDLTEIGGYDVDPHIAALAICNLLEGLSLDYHLNRDVFDRNEANRICVSVARAFFPDHIPAT